jgi:hypothetical protein
MEGTQCTAAHFCPPPSTPPLSPQVRKVAARAAATEQQLMAAAATNGAAAPTNMVDFEELSDIIRSVPDPSSMPYGVCMPMSAFWSWQGGQRSRGWPGWSLCARYIRPCDGAHLNCTALFAMPTTQDGQRDRHRGAGAEEQALQPVGEEGRGAQVRAAGAGARCRGWGWEGWRGAGGCDPRPSPANGAPRVAWNLATDAAAALGKGDAGSGKER